MVLGAVACYERWESERVGHMRWRAWGYGVSMGYVQRDDRDVHALKETCAVRSLYRRDADGVALTARSSCRLHHHSTTGRAYHRIAVARSVGAHGGGRLTGAH